MPFIKAKNGNVVEVDSDSLVKRAREDGHEVSDSDPRKAKAKKAAAKPSDD